MGDSARKYVVRHSDLDVYRRAFDTAMKVFHLTSHFPKGEQYSLTDQVRRSSRSVCANLAEGWRRRRYEADFVHKLSLAESEAAETQVWLEFSVKCGYLEPEVGREIYRDYDRIIATIVGMIHHAPQWTIKEHFENYATDSAPTFFDSYLDPSTNPPTDETESLSL
jgi:four helix bundle protein